MIIHRIRKFVEVWDHSTFWKPILYQLHNLFLIHLETILHRKKTVIWSHPGEMSLGWYRGTEQWPKSKKRCGKSCWKLDYWRAACGESSHLSSRTNWKIIRSPLGAAKRVLCSDLEFKSGWIRSCPLANVKLFKTPCTHNDITAATHHPFPHLSNHKVADVGDLDSEWTCHKIKVFFPALQRRRKNT